MDKLVHIQYNKLANITSGLNQLGPKTVPRFELTILLQMSAFVLQRETDYKITKYIKHYKHSYYTLKYS